MVNNRRGQIVASTLSEGDTLINVDIDSWGGRILSMVSYVVKKRTDTRLVLTRQNSDSETEVRVIIDHDRVTHKIQGYANSYHNRAYLYTPDDPDLVLLKAKSGVDRLRDDARKAVQAWNSSYRDLSKAEEALAALDLWIKAQKLIDSEEKKAAS